MSSKEIQLDPDQKEAVSRALRRVEQGGVMKILGMSGTGKTSIGIEIIKGIEALDLKVVCCALTNKAVGRMIEVGYPARQCRTIHKLIYKTRIDIKVADWFLSSECADKILRSRLSTDDEKAEVDQELAKANVPEDSRRLVIDLLMRGKGERISFDEVKTEEDLEKEGLGPKTVVIVDELSMVPLDATDEINNLFGSVIYIGDPAQLPPIGSPDTCRYLATDDQMELRTIHRIGDGNEGLLQLVHDLHRGKLPDGIGPITPEQVNRMAEDRYKFIAYTNLGVAWINDQCRKALDLFDYLPQPGEPLITMSNVVKASRTLPIDDETREWIYNRARHKEVTFHQDEHGKDVSATIYRYFPKNTELVCAAEPVQIEGTDIWNVPCAVESASMQQIWMIASLPFWDMDPRRKEAFRKAGKSLRVDFSYAITAHRAQGSEYDNVAVMVRQVSRRTETSDEMRDEINKWNYTAAGRARNNTVLFTSIVGCPYS